MERLLKVLGILVVAVIASHLSPHGYFFSVPLLFAHCDTMDGPLIKEAKDAFEKGNVTPVLKWVKKDDEKAIKEIFQTAQKAAKQGKEAKEVALMYFLENLVRIHRAGEGAPYTGIKPAGTKIDEAVAMGDEALVNGKIDGLAEELSGAVKQEILKRYKKAMDLKKNAGKSVEDGRKYIEAYVTYIHFVEGLHNMIKGGGHEHGEEGHEH